MLGRRSAPKVSTHAQKVLGTGKVFGDLFVKKNTFLSDVICLKEITVFGRNNPGLRYITALYNLPLLTLEKTGGRGEWRFHVISARLTQVSS